MGAGNRKASQQRQEGLSRQQEEMGRFFMDQSKQDLAQRRQLQAPVIDYYTQLASGDPSKIMEASAVPLGSLAKMTQQAKANIMEMAPGAARTAALGQLNREAGGQQATLLNQAYLSAFPALQGLASESGSTGLSSAGAGYRGVEGAAGTNNQIMQMQQQQKASQLGLLGSMAGLAGSLVTGGLGASKGGSAGSAGAAKAFSFKDLAPAIPQFATSLGSLSMPAMGGVPIQPAGSSLFSGFPGFSGSPSPFNYQSPQAPSNISSYLSYR